MKKKVIIYGNCHTETMIAMLNTVPAFRERYEVLPCLPIQNIKDPKYLKSAPFKECDIFIHQSIWIKNRYGPEYASENIIKNLKEGCEVIAIPNVYHLPLFLFPNYSPKPEFVFRRGNTCFYRDSVIDPLCRRRASLKDIEKRYLSEQLFDTAKLDEAYDKFISTVCMREKEWDIKVSGFIVDNFRTHQLFFDPNHPTNFFFAYVVCKLLEILGIEYSEEALRRSGVKKLDTSEMPVCPAVRKHFKLSYEEGELRTTGAKVGKARMDIKEYIRQYVSMEWQEKENPLAVRVKSWLMWGRYKLSDRLKWKTRGV